MTHFSPREIVSELDRFIVGQADAKRAVSIALRNRWRRLQLTGSLREEVLPKNILMIGPTGVGKTEIARRLAKLAGDIFGKMGGRTKTRRLTVEDSHELLVNEESDKLLDNDQLTLEAINAVENN